MQQRVSIVSRFYRARSRHWRNVRILFPSPAEIGLIRIMGGHVLTLRFIRHPATRYPLRFVITMGRLFKNERVQREVRVGKYWVDFGNDIQRGIEVDGAEYHADVLADDERAKYFTARGWIILRVPARQIVRNPGGVRLAVQQFLTK